MLARLRQRLSSWSIYAWWAALVIYICARGAFYIPIAENNRQPINIDDSYTYMWQATRLEGCLQTCPAMDTLEPTFRVPSDDFKMNTARVDKISRYLSVYAPLQEGTLALIHTLTGMEWGAVFWVFIGIGVVLQAAGIGLLLRALWGEWPAVLGLVSSGLTLYTPQAQGLHYIVPSNVTLTLAMIVWASIIKDGRQAWRGLLIGVTILAVSHPVGRLYSAMALALYLTAGHWRLTRREWITVTATIAIVGSYWLFARISTAPPIDVTLPYFHPDFPTYFDLVFHQVTDVFHKIGDALKDLTLIPYLFMDTLMFIGALYITQGSKPRRWRTWIFFVLTFGMYIAAAFTSLPAYPAEANRRVILVFQIALSGARGALMVWSLSHLSVLFSQHFRLKNRTQIAHIFVSFFVAMIACSSWAMIIFNGVADHSDNVALYRDFENYELSRDDLEIILNQSDATIIYTHQVSTLYSLSSGLYKFEAIYPAVLDTPVNLAQVDYIVALQSDPLLDPLQDLKLLYPDGSIEENFQLVAGLKSDLRIYERRVPR